MIGDKNNFSSLTLKKGGYVSYDKNKNQKLLVLGTTIKRHNPTFEDVFFVEGLKHNLLRISELCEKGNELVFDYSICNDIQYENEQTIFTSKKMEIPIL